MSFPRTPIYISNTHSFSIIGTYKTFIGPISYHRNNNTAYLWNNHMACVRKTNWSCPHGTRKCHDHIVRPLTCYIHETGIGHN